MENIYKMALEKGEALLGSIRISGKNKSGGIKEENLLQLRGNGLCGVAVISAIFAQKDIEAATRRLHALAEEMAGDQE